MDTNQAQILFGSKEISSKYIKYRPEVSEKIFENIISYYSQRSSCFKLALDIGCGSGQSTFKLSEYFDEIIGVDINETQIKQVPKSNPSNIRFIVADAQTLAFCESESVDLITISSALHWIPNKETFYKETKRVLKTNGVLAVSSYYFPEHKNNNKSSGYFKEWFNENIVKQGYMPPGYEDTMNLYADIKLPLLDTIRLDMTIDTVWSVDRFVQLMETTSTIQCLFRDNPTSKVLDGLREGLYSLNTSNGK